MENDTEVIKQQMAETRTALSEKLEAVEDLVASTVKETTQTVTDTVAAVTDTVENTVQTVASTVTDSWNLSNKRWTSAATWTNTRGWS